MTERVIKKIDSELEYCHCHDAFNQLSCQHMFCKLPCPEKLFARDGYYPICPTCRKNVPLSDRGVAELQLLMHIDHLKETKQALDKAEKPTECENCGKETAIEYCQECQKGFLCNQCREEHKKSKITRFHTVKSIDELRQEAQKIKAPSETVPTCHKHTRSKLNGYCDTCKELICIECTTEGDQHKDHIFSQQAEVGQVFSEHKKKLVSSLKPKQIAIKRSLEILDKHETDLRNKEHTHKVDIEKMINKKIQLLQKEQTDFINELETCTKQKLKTLATKKKRVEAINEKLTSYLEYIEEATKPGMQCEVLEIKDPMLERIEYISTELDQVSLLPKTTDLVLNGKKLEEVEKISCITPVESIDIKEPCKVINKLKKPWGVAVNSKGCIITAEYGSGKILIYSSNYEEIERFDSQCSAPAGVTVDNDDNIYISNRKKHTIQKFMTHGKFIVSVGTKGDGERQFNQPVGLGYNKTNSKIYVSEEFNNRVQVLNTDLTFHSFINISGLNKPAGISFDSIGNAYIANFGAHNVIQCDSSGRLLRIFGMYGTGPGQLNHPLGITVSNTYLVYVTEIVGRRISIFKADGEFICSFENKLFKGPAGIALDSNGHTVVSDRENDCIQVFQSHNSC